MQVKRYTAHLVWVFSGKAIWPCCNPIYYSTLWQFSLSKVDFKIKEWYTFYKCYFKNVNTLTLTKTFLCFNLKHKTASFFKQFRYQNDWLTLNLYCVLLLRFFTVQVKSSPVYFGWKRLSWKGKAKKKHQYHQIWALNTFVCRISILPLSIITREPEVWPLLQKSVRIPWCCG